MARPMVLKALRPITHPHYRVLGVQVPRLLGSIRCRAGGLNIYYLF
jgi:hypothetical protein